MRTKTIQFLAFALALFLVSNIQAQNEKAPVKKSTEQRSKQIDAPPPPPSPIAEDKVYEEVEEMPRFPGCEDQGLIGKELEKCAMNKLSMYIFRKLSYPAEAREKGIQGTVLIEFIVGKDGKILDPKIVKDVGKGQASCGQAALKVVKQMQAEVIWKAGKERGRPVKVRYTIPLKFNL